MDFSLTGLVSKAFRLSCGGTGEGGGGKGEGRGNIKERAFKIGAKL